MAQFKVGDMVRKKDGHYTGMTPGSPYNLPGAPLRVAWFLDGNPGRRAMIVELEDGSQSPAVNPDCFEIAGPVRTVTRREIVPGVYGIVDVGGARDGGVLAFVSTSSIYSAEQLRAAACTFNELADALDENAA